MVVVILVGGGTGYLISRSTTPLYRSDVTILVLGTRGPGVPTSSELEGSERLAETLTTLAGTKQNIQEIALRLNISIREAGAFTTLAERSTLLITATSPDANKAAQIADTAAEVFIENFQQRQFEQIAQFQAALGQFDLEDTGSIITARAAAVSTLDILQNAEPAESPYIPRTRLNVATAVIVGLLVAIIVIAAIEHMDDRVKTAGQLRSLTGITTLGTLYSSRGRSFKHVWERQDSKEHSNNAPVAFGFLQTSLEFASLAIPNLKSILVTSAGPVEGKTTVAANLAVSMARSGRKVTLIDCDMRRPRVISLLGLTAEFGLTHLLIGKANLEQAMIQTFEPNLKVLGVGTLPPDPVQVLRTHGMSEIVEELKADGSLVIFDSPPLLVATDPMILSSLTDGVLLVVDASKTRQQSIKDAVHLLEQGASPILGAMLNRVAFHRSNETSLYYDYLAEYEGHDNTNGHKPANLRARLKGILGRQRS